jgi:predicted nucleic acid-binding protein
VTHFVLDASMALAWHFPNEQTPHTMHVAEITDSQTAVVPWHWFAEIANGMLIGDRKSRTTSEERALFIDRLSLLDLEIDTIEPEAMFDRILPLARVHRLTVYDTLYLELAERRGLPLASLDRALIAAAGHVGIGIVGDLA